MSIFTCLFSICLLYLLRTVLETRDTHIKICPQATHSLQGYLSYKLQMV